MDKRVLLTCVVLSLCLCAETSGLHTSPADSPRSSSSHRHVRDEPTLPSDIVGGERTLIYIHKHQVAIVSRKHTGDILGCGGSIINNNWIVTAGHCCDGRRKSDMTIRAGSSFYGIGGDLYYVSKIIYHANYDEETTDYDICVMETTKPIIFGTRVQPITMVEEGTRHPAGTIASVTGWGIEKYEEGAEASFVLKVVEVPIVSLKECREKYGVGPQNLSSHITDRQICAGSHTGGKDTCQGDSGGPMVIQGQLVGVTSWGNGCGNASYPGVYANVAIFRRWIRLQTGV